MKPVNIYFTLYYKQRSYGGPEEGGWWFTSMEAIETVKCKAKQTIVGNNYSFTPTKKALQHLRKQDKNSFLLPENCIENHCEIYPEKIRYYHQNLGQHYC